VVSIGILLSCAIAEKPSKTILKIRYFFILK
jgi:hypothetical protein